MHLCLRATWLTGPITRLMGSMNPHPCMHAGWATRNPNVSDQSITARHARADQDAPDWGHAFTAYE